MYVRIIENGVVCEINCILKHLYQVSNLRLSNPNSALEIQSLTAYVFDKQFQDL